MGFLAAWGVVNVSDHLFNWRALCFKCALQALHSGGSLWHLDKGLLRFILSNLLQKVGSKGALSFEADTRTAQDDNVCDLGAFGGHYSKWLNVRPSDDLQKMAPNGKPTVVL